MKIKHVSNHHLAALAQCFNSNHFQLRTASLGLSIKPIKPSELLTYDWARRIIKDQFQGIASMGFCYALILEKKTRNPKLKKKNRLRKISNKYLNLFENLASLRPQASSLPWLFAPSYHCSCLDHAPLGFPKALRREDTQIEQPPKTQEECFGFSQATETLSGRSSYTQGSHISVCFSWFLHFYARHLFPFFAQRIQGLSTENSCQIFSARSR